MALADDLRAAVAADDGVAIRLALAPLDEVERADLVPLAREVVRQVVPRGVDAVGQVGSMLLLAYGTLAVTDIRKLGWRSNHLRGEVVEVLRRRSSERLLPIVAYLLEDVGGATAWAVARPLVREGIVPVPDSPAYTIAMLAATRWRPAAELLAEDPGLLDIEVWRLFEVEGGSEDSLANHEKFYGDSWGDSFRAQAATDAAARERLLDASLAALGRDFSQYRAGWFSRFHESLAPTDEERAKRASAYLALLRSRVGPTVSFAVAALQRIDRAGLLDGPAVLDQIGPVLSEGAAGTARAGLDLVSRSAAASPPDASRAAIVAVEGFRHPAPDVQRRAIALVAELVTQPDPDVAAAVAASGPEVAASQLPAAQALLERLGGTAAAASPEARPVAPTRRPPAAVVTSPTDSSRSLEPLSSPEAVVNVAVSVLETGEPADDVERVLDGVRRLGHRGSPDFDRLVAPLARRARTLLGRRDSVPFTGFDPRADIAAVLLAWTTGEVVDAPAARRSVDAGAGAFLSARAREAAAAVAGDRPTPSVALPTHRGGWIEPRVLVERLIGEPPASTLDLVAAILRLAPDGRPEALEAAHGIRAEVGDVLRYALGGDERVGGTAAWWVAAARTRSPGRDDPAVDRRHPRLGADAALAAIATLRIGKPTGTFEHLVLDVRPRPAGKVPIEMPTALLLNDASVFPWGIRSDAAMLRWISTIQPGYRESWSAAGSLQIGGNLDWWSAEWGNRAYLEPFTDPWAALGPQAQALVGISLGAKEAGQRGLAADVAGVAIADDRLDAVGLAQGLAVAASLGLDRPRRWALSLADVASDSERHAATVAEAVGRAMPAMHARPAGELVPLLRLLDELLAGTGDAAVVEARTVLDTVAAGGGSAGRLARSILARGRVTMG